MKRDMDLLRQILLAVEADDWQPGNRPDVPGHSDEAIDYHVWLAADAGLLEGVTQTTRGKTLPVAAAKWLTFAGHDWLAAARNDSIWRKAMAGVAAVGGAVTLSTLKTYLDSLIRQQLGVPPADHP